MLTEQLKGKVFDNLIQKHFELKNSTLYAHNLCSALNSSMHCTKNTALQMHVCCLVALGLFFIILIFAAPIQI